MTVNYKTLALLVLISLALISCEGHKTAVGGVGGAAAGGFLGHALGGGTAGIIGGAIAGGLIGGAIGNRMDAADRRESERAAQQAFETAPSGQTAQWSNPRQRQTMVPLHRHAPSRQTAVNTAENFSKRWLSAAKNNKRMERRVVRLTAVGKL